ncbi:MAG: flagellar hook assembly protein FlgD [Alphaproteobacteria bacterium]|jgi:flagellar basal-body rod modification protein FlgD|uniref:flagellar hook assembly protein FlgD n=1 Tax=unclassified Rhizobium TaxID=2613769 RepID=UPI0006B979C8|nr:flagellar hook assembly protein FlgD [Rhizobium sp. AAP116]MBU0737658.1 flagellar hook assembly protein FlgD [Alphaproteobacteria bacterium]MDM7979208.1 flagellar hook assembly protein FlgD [Rhizobium sp.]KPF55202.1 flagellar biosynthesis protein FlgD [Rhizobium sp. AAP116]MBU0834438.1 flagellar hook assembly protein FlgD [Alphaproteobacteria bacterium]MBU1763131.1 flagellar hook assembly protein FlgD [Alphaproteobacteria bacterium]
MAVDGVAAATAATTTSSATSSTASKAAEKASIDYDSFLKLLIAQMKNQDPTNPMDATEQISQLATFSQVEQTIQTNSNLETLITGNALSNASSYIGKTITSADEKTTGVIASVRVYSDTMVATTAEGKEIPITVGVRVGTKPTTSGT